MATKYKYNFIKTCRTYSIDEVSHILGVHTRTVGQWIKFGNLCLLNPGNKPYLISGKDLKKFLYSKKNQRKVTLNDDQFYCLKCRIAVLPISNTVVGTLTEKVLGSGYNQIILSAKCENCNVKILKFTSTKYLQELTSSFKQLTFSGSVEKASFSGNLNRTLKD